MSIKDFLGTTSFFSDFFHWPPEIAHVKAVHALFRTGGWAVAIVLHFDLAVTYWC